MEVVNPGPVACSSPSCLKEATILHREAPYCGAHALLKLEAGEKPDCRDDVISRDARQS